MLALWLIENLIPSMTLGLPTVVGVTHVYPYEDIPCFCRPLGFKARMPSRRADESVAHGLHLKSASMRQSQGGQEAEASRLTA